MASSGNKESISSDDPRVCTEGSCETDVTSNETSPLILPEEQRRTDHLNFLDLPIHEVSLQIHSLAENAVKEPEKAASVVTIDDNIVTMIRERADVACVVVTLAVYRDLIDLADSDPVLEDLYLSRARWVQELAIRLVKSYKSDHDRVTLFTQVLTTRFPSLRPSLTGREGGVENALDIAIDTRCIRFLKNTQECIEHIWEGDIHLQPHQPTSNLLCPPISSQSRFDRLKIPKYQYLFHLVFFFAFLTSYTVVVNQKSAFLHDAPGFWETIMWIFALSFAMEEAHQAYVGGIQFYLISLWNWLDIASTFIFAVAFLARMVGLFGFGCSFDDKGRGWSSCSLWTASAFDLLAVNAIFLWLRTLNVLSCFEFFGNLLVVVKKMLSEALLFVAILIVVLIGFVQAFFALDIKNREASSSLYMLLRSLLDEPSYEEAESYHRLGSILLLLYMMISGIILLNLLIAIFSDTYTKSVEESNGEYLYDYSLKVMSYFKRPDDFPFIAPLNLLDILLFPLAKVLPYRAYKRLEKSLWVFSYLPLHGALAIYEIYIKPPKSMEAVIEHPPPFIVSFASPQTTTALTSAPPPQNETRYLVKDMGDRIVATIAELSQEQKELRKLLEQVLKQKMEE